LTALLSSLNASAAPADGHRGLFAHRVFQKKNQESNKEKKSIGAPSIPKSKVGPVGSANSTNWPKKMTGGGSKMAQKKMLHL